MDILQLIGRTAQLFDDDLFSHRSELLKLVSSSRFLVIGPRPQTQRCFGAFPLSAQNEIKKVRPGLSGIGSIIFRNEEEMMQTNNDPDKFYDEIIMPYKGSLEEWYTSN